MSCQICVEVVRLKRSRWTREFELSTTDRFGGLLYDRKQLAKSNEYYHKIHPTEAAEVDARLAEEKAKAEAKAKAAARSCCGQSCCAAAAAKRAAAEPAALRHRKPRRLKERVSDDREGRSDLRSAAHWLVAFCPHGWQTAAGVVAGRGGHHLLCFPALFAIDGAAGAQRAWGACRIGSARIAWVRSASLQPVADGIKSLTKEDIVPLSADAVVHFLAPVVLVVVVFMGFAVLPMGRNMVLVDMDAGLLFYFAMGASTELSVFMAGWSSRNKYSLLGAMRAVAQMISYEVPLLLSSVAVVMMTGSLSLVKIVEAQNQYTLRPAALVHLHAVGICGIRDVRDCGDGGDESVALRFAGRRVGAGCWLLYRVFGIQVCAVFPGRVCGHVVDLGAGRDAVSGRVVGAVGGSGLGAVVDLVLRESDACDCACSSGCAARCRG